MMQVLKELLENLNLYDDCRIIGSLLWFLSLVNCYCLFVILDNVLKMDSVSKRFCQSISYCCKLCHSGSMHYDCFCNVRLLSPFRRLPMNVIRLIFTD